MYAAHMQRALGATMLFQIPDEEKFLFKDTVTAEESKRWAFENILDIIVRAPRWTVSAADSYSTTSLLSATLATRLQALRSAAFLP
jgi:presenilin-like A22 family membrane protease